MNLCDIRVVREVMESHGLTFKKEFGQNFLTNPGIVSFIAEQAGKNTQTVLEIGPGIGTLTRELAVRYDKVIAVEIDRGLIPVLADTLADCPNVTVLNQDILKTDLKALLEENPDLAVVGNLPYYITSEILMMLLESRLPFKSLTFMVQKEVAERVCSPVGGKLCGAITATINYYGTATYLCDVPSSDFVPAPKVDSAVLRIDLHKENPWKPMDEKTFFNTVKGAFLLRRKTLPNSLAALFSDLGKDTLRECILACGLSETIRGERLTMEDFVRLSDEIYKRRQAKCSEKK